MIKQPLRRRFLYWSVTVFFIIYSITLIFPFLWAFLGAMRDKQEYIENFLGLPTKFDLSNFGKAFKEFRVFESDFMDMLITSIIFTACGTFMQVGSSLLTAYTIAKYNFKLRGFLYGLAVFIMIIPIVGSTPSMYKLVVDLGINDDPVGISLLYAGGFGMNFIILHGYIKGISWTYAEAAFVDGATDFQVFTKIMIPQTVPALVAIGVTSAISMWNDYHVDDYLVSGRTLSWMQMKYGVTGNLYWATTIYKKYTNGGYVARDLWNDPMSYATKDGANGDGFLVYPGRKYGVKGPISTLRLESIREGMEDYEYLYMLRDILKEKGAEFNQNVEINDYIESLYAMLFSGTITNFKQDNIAFARREIASLITQLSNADSPLIVISGINGKTATATAEIYAKADSVEVNGVTISKGVSVGEGKKFVASVSLNGDANYVSVKANGNEYRRFVSARTVGLASFDDQAECARVTTSKFTAGSDDTVASLNGDPKYIKAGTGSLKINLKPAGNSSYARTASIDVTKNGAYADFSSVRSICLVAYADMPKNCNIFISLVDKNGMTYGVGSFYLQSGVWKNVKMGVMNVGSIDFKNIAKIEIEFPEIRSSTGYDEAFDFYIDNLFIENEIK